MSKEHIQHFARITKMRSDLRKTRTHILYRCAMVLCLALGYHLGSLHHWNTDRPPTQQKLQVITYGWADKEDHRPDTGRSRQEEADRH